MRLCKSDVGYPGLIQVLKKALGGGKARPVPVRVELRDGLFFIDEVIEVMQVGTAEAAVAVFRNNPQVVMADIDSVTVVATA